MTGERDPAWLITDLSRRTEALEADLYDDPRRGHEGLLTRVRAMKADLRELKDSYDDDVEERALVRARLEGRKDSIAILWRAVGYVGFGGLVLGVTQILKLLGVLS